MRVLHRALVLILAVLLPVSPLKAYRPAEGDPPAVTGKNLSSGRKPSQIFYHNSGIDFREIRDPSGRYCRIILPGHHFTSETGKPELPVYSQLVEVSPGTTIEVKLTDIKSERIRFSDHGLGGAHLFPAQPARTKNEQQDEKVVIKDKKFYASRGKINHDTVIVSREGIFRGKELYTVAVYPAFYDPSGGYVDLIKSMNLKISYLSQDSKGEADYEAMDEKGDYGSNSYITGYTDQPVQMIIVADTMFSRHLQPLLRWKTLKGIKTTVLYKRAGSADSVYSDLKRRISALYSDAVSKGIPLHYLLIIGDPVLIPTSRNTKNVSDLYYGEFDGEGDYIPELFIGRLPVSDTTQLKAVVKKIVDYESHNFSPRNDFWKGALATAGNAPGFENYMNGQVKYVYSNYLSQDTSIKATWWLYPEAQQKDDSLKIMINKGLGILNYTGHGEASGFSDPTLKTASVNELTNISRYPLVIANACRTAQINVAGCFGSAMVNAADKGAIGYIGCTNDSFWTDDFYWAVGPGVLGTDADYGNTGLGAFDRLFHTHNESPGDWYYTSGQINFAGNLAVSSSTSPRKKYYWETYMLLGDPSLAPMIGRPDTFRVQLPDKLPQALRTLNFFSEPFSYAAISNFDTLWDARFVSPSGSVSLDIPPEAKDSCLLVLTGQNMKPYRKTIKFGTVQGAFITVENIVYDDSQGNGNGKPDYGEKIKLSVTVRNLGGGASANLTADLSVISGMIKVESGSAVIGVLGPGASYTISNSFLFSVSDAVADGELASLLLDISDNGNHFPFGIDMTLQAPELKIISSIHDDLSTGNANYLPDPGETIIMKARVKNSGSSATSGTLTAVPHSTGLSFRNPVLATGTLDPGTEKIIGFEAVVSDKAVPGTVIRYDLNLVCGKYEAGGTWSISTGKTRETWEYERFDIFPWITRGDYPWVITTSTAFENTHSARSGTIPDKTESVLAIYVNNPVTDTISFWSRVSSEPSYDEMIFRIDSITDLQISGDTPWALRKAILKPGIHYLEWVYRKDVSLSGGLDAAWIDHITFPDISFLEADLRIDSVYPPPPTVDLNKVTITGRVINFGRNTLTSFPLAYRINNGAPVIETFFKKIDPGDTVDIAFTETTRLLPDVSYIINIISQLPEDGYSGNDTAYTAFIKSGTGPDLTESNVKIMPNPFADRFVLELDDLDAEEVAIEMIDAGGRTVLRSRYAISPGSNQIAVDCRHLAAGAYTLRVTSGSGSISLRTIKV